MIRHDLAMTCHLTSRHSVCIVGSPLPSISHVFAFLGMSKNVLAFLSTQQPCTFVAFASHILSNAKTKFEQTKYSDNGVNECELQKTAKNSVWKIVQFSCRLLLSPCPGLGWQSQLDCCSDCSILLRHPSKLSRFQVSSCIF